MKTLTKIALAIALFATAAASHAQWVNGYSRANGTYVSGHYRSTPGYSYSTSPSYSYTPSYPTHRSSSSFGSSYTSPGRSSSGYSSSSRDYVYRNPYAASPYVNVRGYSRHDGTFVAPHVRTSPNDTVTDNLSYRGYGTIRVPKY